MTDLIAEHLETRIDDLTDYVDETNNQINIFKAEVNAQNNINNNRYEDLVDEDIELHNEIHQLGVGVSVNSARINNLEVKSENFKTIFKDINKLNRNLYQVNDDLHTEVHKLAGRIGVDWHEIHVDDTDIPSGGGEINSGGGTVYVEKYGTDDLYSSLLIALDENDDYTVFDCTYFTGETTFPDTVEITKPCTILLGNITITTQGLNFFEIKSGNVQIIGYGRQTDRTAVNVKNATILIMNQASFTNESDKGYHIYSKGNKNLRFEYLTLKGVRTTLGRQCNNDQYSINGCGGIFIEKGNPTRTFFGNTCNNIIINQLLIDGTKTHGIYISTPILSTITNTRLSYIAGHGIFLDGATSVLIDNVYAATAQLAGFCLLGVNYVTLNNCVSELGGIGFLIRGSFNVSVFSPGIEESINQGNNPWSGAYNVTQKYGFNVTTTGYAPDDNGNYIIPETKVISDVTSDLYNAFTGTPFMVVGGRGISFYTPYATGIARGGNGTYNVNRTALLRIVGNARKIFVNNIQGAYLQGAAEIYNDIKIESNSDGAPNGVEIVYDVTQPLITSDFTNYITQYDATFAPIYCSPLAQNILIRNGGTFYSNISFDNELHATHPTFDTLETKNLKVSNNSNGFVEIDGDTGELSLKQIASSETSTNLTLIAGSIGQNTGNDNDTSGYIKTSEYMEWSDGMTYNITLGRESGYNTRLYRYTHVNNEYVYQGYNDLGKLTANDFSIINDFMQDGEYFRLRFETSNTTNVSMTVTSVSLSELNKILLTPNGNGSFVGNIYAANFITSNTNLNQLSQKVDELEDEIDNIDTSGSGGGITQTDLDNALAPINTQISTISTNVSNLASDVSDLSDEVSQIDLSIYATTSDLNTATSNINTQISTISTNINNLSSDVSDLSDEVSQIDLTDYTTNSDVQTSITSSINALKTELEEKYKSIDLTTFISSTGNTLNYTISELVKHHLYCDRTGAGRWATCQVETSASRTYIYFDYNQSNIMYRRFIYITESNGVITHNSNFRHELFTNTSLA